MSLIAIGEVAEIAPAGIGFRIPVVGQLDFAARIARRAQEDQRVAALFVVGAPDFFEPEAVAIEFEAVLDIGHADHRVQIFHRKSRLKRGGKRAFPASRQV